MAASYPTSVKTFGTRNTGDVVQASHVNELQEEVAAVETQLLAAATGYVPTWGNNGTANTLGNGTIAGQYIRIGNMVFFHLTLIWGSTTVSGNGSWSFSLPVTASAGGVLNAGSARATDTGTGTYFMGLRALSTTTVDVLSGSPESAVSATVPFTWVSTDVLHVSGWYFAA